MLEQVEVYYEGWGERWLWGTLVRTKRVTSRPITIFEYSKEAIQHKIELCSLKLPLKNTVYKGFPEHQYELPGPVYDALPDGWGMLLMDRLFRQRNLSAASIGPLERLAYIGNNALGAMTFVPVAQEGLESQQHISLGNLAIGVQEVMQGEGAEFIETLMQVGGSPHGARPKALVYKDPISGTFTTAHIPGYEPWLVKFPAKSEDPEVCAIESVYSACLSKCGIDTPDTMHFDLPSGNAAFASKRFDRYNGIRVPVQSLAAFTGAYYRTPGALSYEQFLRATHICTLDISQKSVVFERALFNVIFNNRDDHTKNFAYLMDKDGRWKLSPAYDVTYCTGPGGWHQMDIMGAGLDVHREHIMALAKAANMQEINASKMIEDFSNIASQFTQIAESMYGDKIKRETLNEIQGRINTNIANLRA